MYLMLYLFTSYIYLYIAGTLIGKVSPCLLEDRASRGVNYVWLLGMSS
jgi:hypothetical protein